MVVDVEAARAVAAQRAPIAPLRFRQDFAGETVACKGVTAGGFCLNPER
jgi:hypothetical protein